MNNLAMYVLSIPSAMVAYICICHLATKRWQFFEPALWGYAVLLGGTVIYFGFTFGTTDFPQPGKLVSDCGLVLLSWREFKILRTRRKVNDERKLSKSV